ncbi:M48 family peptidase [bacterium]|nr:M48 family peptidase [bacterium]
MSQGMIAQLGMGVADLWLKDKSYRNMGLAALGAGAQFGLILPFSRSNETEADTLGIKYAAMAGYDPAEGPRFWTRFSKVTGAGGKPPAWMSTHPSDTSRIRNLKALQQEAEGLYEKSGKYGLGEKI